MIEAYPAPMLFVGQLLYSVAAFVRFVRLYVSLAAARPPVASELAVTHCLGVALGYFFGILWYEFTLLLFFTFRRRGALVAVFAALLLLRGLDAACLLFLSVYVAPYENMRLMLLFLCALLLGIGFFFISFNAVLRRIEKKLLELPDTSPGIIFILQYLHVIRGQFTLLAWQRQGNVSIFIFLTVSGWFLEWLAFFCLQPTGRQALTDMLGRISGSLHLMRGHDVGSISGALQPGVWGLLLLTVVIMLLARLLKGRLFRSTQI